MESARSHIIATIHRDLDFLFALAVTFDKHEIGVVPSSSPQELDVLLRDLQLKPKMLVIDNRIEGVCRHARVLQDRWPRLTVLVIVLDCHSCNYCERFLRVFANEVETVSSLIQEIIVTKSVQKKGTGQVTKKRRRGILKHSEGGAT